jgi:hypothetical protein
MYPHPRHLFHIPDPGAFPCPYPALRTADPRFPSAPVPGASRTPKLVTPSSVIGTFGEVCWLGAIPAESQPEARLGWPRWGRLPAAAIQRTSAAIRLGIHVPSLAMTERTVRHSRVGTSKCTLTAGTHDA